jgi:hypothetical protein
VIALPSCRSSWCCNLPRRIGRLPLLEPSSRQRRQSVFPIAGRDAQAPRGWPERFGSLQDARYSCNRSSNGTTASIGIPQSLCSPPSSCAPRRSGYGAGCAAPRHAERLCSHSKATHQRRIKMRRPSQRCLHQPAGRRNRGVIYVVAMKSLIPPLTNSGGTNDATLFRAQS